MSGLDERPFPRGALLGAAFLIAATIVGVGINQIVKFSAPAPQTQSAETVIASRDLRFVDQGGGVNAFGGAVAVFDDRTGDYIANLTPTDGFIRVVLNSLAFERTKRNIAADTVFTLVMHAGNRMFMVDPVTGRSVNLGAFGPDNRHVFVKFLPDAGFPS